jgi:hypothetical protein
MIDRPPTPDEMPVRSEMDPVELQVASIIFREARRAHRYTPADERAERIAEEQADEE